MNARYPVLLTLVAALSLLIATGSRSEEPAKAEKPAADAMLGQEAGQVRDDNGLNLKLVWCPPGYFKMENSSWIVEDVPAEEESDENVPKEEVVLIRSVVERSTTVKVFLKRGYWLGKYEVTQAEWKRVMATEPWKEQNFLQEGDQFPATYITWDGATQFCRKLTDQERHSGRLPDDWEYTLPTEAQWERACRARMATRFSYGDEESKLGEYGWFANNTRLADESYAHRVGEKKANRWGLFDMHGNVWEWCRDFYVEKLPGGFDPEATQIESYRVLRGGCWFSEAHDCRSSYRTRTSSDFRYEFIGFRLALSPVR